MTYSKELCSCKSHQIHWLESPSFRMIMHYNDSMVNVSMVMLMMILPMMMMMMMMMMVLLVATMMVRCRKPPTLEFQTEERRGFCQHQSLSLINEGGDEDVVEDDGEDETC